MIRTIPLVTEQLDVIPVELLIEAAGRPLHQVVHVLDAGRAALEHLRHAATVQPTQVGQLTNQRHLAPRLITRKTGTIDLIGPDVLPEF
jgi:hypothetical protein